MKTKIISWLFLAVSIACAYAISFIEDYSLIFLIVLLANFGFASFYAKKLDKTVLNVSRLLLGALFVYSGTVKGVDPLGTQFRIEDYFYAYGTEWAVPFALFLSVVLNAAEFALGALLILRIKTNWVSVLTTLMMLLFTITTLYDALYSPVPDCGCFGDALIITNWQTFYKNLVINAFVIVVLLRRSTFSEYRSKALEYSGIFLVVFGFVFFEYYNIKNLPTIDFRSWKVGNRLVPENPQPVKYFLTYKNIKTGEETEYLSNELPWQDSVLMSNLKWASSREEDPNINEMNTFPMLDENGEDLSKQIVSDSNYTFIFVIYKLEKVNTELVPYINDFYESATALNYNVVMLSSDLPSEYNTFCEENNMVAIPTYNSDDTALKAAIRSNPGLIIVRNGAVIKKYHQSKFPEFNELIKELK